MKKTIVFLAVFLVLGASLVMSQPVSGKKFELGTAFSFTSFKFSDSTDSDSVLSLPLRLGYFVWKGLEIEPEVMLMKFSGSEAAYHVSANLAYNFKVPGQVVPFVLGGVGVGNGFSAGPLVEGDTDVNAFLINAGGGIKYVIGKAGAIRVEYRFTSNRLSQTGFPSETVSSHQIFIGVSLFF
jgi:hypothetical protein